MNRIYQGRVSKVEVFDKDRETVVETFGSAELENELRSPLWNHHVIFQDAINYYLVALGALAHRAERHGDRLLDDLAGRLNEAWMGFPRKTDGPARSLRESVGPWLRLGDNATIKDAFAAILEGCEAPPEARKLALALLLDRCGGESAIQQGGRGYFPRFCDAKAASTYDFSPEQVRAQAGKERLASVLHAESQKPSELEAIANEMDLSWTVKVTPKKFFEDEEAKARLIEAVDHFKKIFRNDSSQRIQELIAEFPDHDERLEAIRGLIESAKKTQPIPRNRKASKELTFGTLLFKHFPDTFTASLLALFIKKPSSETTTDPAIQPEQDFARLGDDPIRLARGERGYVFPAFTALPDWQPENPGMPVWKEFDIAAFKEALKGLNQFHSKTVEREENRNQIKGEIAAMLGKPIQGWKPLKSESGEVTGIPEPIPQDLLKLASQLEEEMTATLADTTIGEPEILSFGEASYTFREGAWKITRSALRGFRDITEKWNKAYRENGGAPSPDMLAEIVKESQREEKNKLMIGSVPLFLKLCEKPFHPLWVSDESIEESDSEESEEAATFTAPVLHRMASLHLKIRDYRRSLDPIQLTPAEPRFSRRLYMFSDVKGAQAKVEYGCTKERGATVTCAIARRDERGILHCAPLRLTYSAPRLLRDELLGGGESRWLQPMMRALGIDPEPLDNGTFDSAVSLMPDFSSQSGATTPSQLRFLLNFPVTLDTEWIQKQLKRPAFWQGQFNGTRDKHLHLHWKSTVSKNSKAKPWWQQDEILKKGFTTVAVDLGQRSAGAWAHLRITAFDPRDKSPSTRRPVHEIGFDGETRWFAEIMRTGMLRLPGEDQKVQQPDGSFLRERSGKAGRNSSREEWVDAVEISRLLSAEDPHSWIGDQPLARSFPEQNDGLLALASRRLSRLNTFHRWSCFDPERPEILDRAEKMIKDLKDELAHWRDEEVADWKGHLEKGDYAAFREAAGKGFTTLRESLAALLVRIANRVVPLRDRSWRWVPLENGKTDGTNRELRDDGPAPDFKTKIRGQRGLSMQRIEQLENLRRLFLRHNRSLDREPGERAKFGRSDRGRETGEPCRPLLEKIDRLKEQRINQTAHLILAQSLGVALKEHTIDPDERQARDIHGEYKQIKNREPVDFIVIENLDRYLTFQGRAPSENSRLMKWAHRAVRDKIVLLAEPFGIPVVEAPAAYSSRFCARTGAPGLRCEELSTLPPFLQRVFEEKAQKSSKEAQGDEAAVWRKLLDQFTALEMLNREWAASRFGGHRPGDPVPKSPKTLYVPRAGGPLFVPIRGGKPVQADMNAAANIGLRAVAGPEALHLIHKVRTNRVKSALVPLAKNAREKALCGDVASITLKGEPSQKLANAHAPNFFVDPFGIADFDQACLLVERKGEGRREYPIASGIGLWATVNKGFLKRLIELNDQRLIHFGTETV